MKLTFFGGVGTVTGSKILLSLDNGKNILIECGLFQGPKVVQQRNWEHLPFAPHTIQAIILTHAHIDHTGFLPVFVKNGFAGSIYSTYGTRDLCDVLLQDSAHLQESDAKHLSDVEHTVHTPLYVADDVPPTLQHFVSKHYNQPFDVVDNLNCEFLPCGHIIGAALVKITYKNQSLLFSGDLGRLHDPIMKPPTIVRNTDYLVLEATYGNRIHDKEHPKNLLKNIIHETLKTGGTLVISAFAVGRSQIVLHYLVELKKSGEIPDIPIFLDSPMAVQATDILIKYKNEHKLTEQECNDLKNHVNYIQTAEESMALDQQSNSKIIVSASGMATGGRILHHLKQYLPDPNSAVLFTGFQTEETRGAKLVSGQKNIAIYGQHIPVYAKIYSLKSTSAHADSDEIIEWLKNFKTPPKKIFLNHSEYESAQGLKNKIKTALNWDCIIPQYGQGEPLE